MKKIYIGISLILIVNLFAGCNFKPNKIETSTIEDMNLNDEEEANRETNTSNFYPIIVAYKNLNGYYSNGDVIGGIKDGEWYSYSDFDLPNEIQVIENYENDFVKGGEVYNFYSNEECVISKKGGNPKLVYYGSLGRAILNVEFDPFKINNDNFIIGISGDWNAMPRTVKKNDDNSLLIDIDNDGIKEKIKIFESTFKDEVGEDIRKIDISINNSEKEIIFDLITIDYVYSGENVDLLFLDLNGDNELELLTVVKGHTLYIEVYKFKNKQLHSILDFYIGD